MIVDEARTALEAAARTGVELPAWVAQIMTEAGWQHYHSLCVESTAVQATLRGVTGFQQRGMTTQATQETIPREATQRTATAPHTSHEKHQKLNSLKALAAEICAHIGGPCSRCSCTLFYQSGSYWMCHLCYPRPAKFGRLTDEQWQRLQTLFPRNLVSFEPFKRSK